jgi:hypothetical protein
MSVAKQLGKNIHSVAALGETKGAAISRDKKVMIGLNSSFAHE